MALFTLDVSRDVAPTISAGNLDLGYFEGTMLIALSEDTLEDYMKDQSESESDTEEDDDESDRNSDKYSTDGSRSRRDSSSDSHRDSDGGRRRYSNSDRDRDSDSDSDNYRHRRCHSDNDNESNSHSEQYSERDIEDHDSVSDSDSDSDSDRDRDSDDHSNDDDEEETQSYRGLGSKRKQFPTKAEPSHIKKQCGRIIKTTRAPAHRVFIRLRGRETGEGEIQPDPVSGYLDFSNEDFTKFVGMIDLPYLSGSVKLEGFKVSTTAKRQYESWSSFSEGAYERARVARWR